MEKQTKEQVMVKEHNRILLDNLIEQERKEAISEFKEKLKKACDEQDLDIMVTDGENGEGDITIPLSEFIEKTAQEMTG